MKSIHYYKNNTYHVKPRQFQNALVNPTPWTIEENWLRIEII